MYISLKCRCSVRTLPNKCPWYGIKQTDAEVRALKIWEIWSTASLQLLPDSLFLEEVAPNMVLSVDQMELSDI